MSNIGYAGDILHVLLNYDVTAAFFLIGKLVHISSSIYYTILTHTHTRTHTHTHIYIF